jgi:hypothetical protein
VPNINVVKRRLRVESTSKLGNKSNGILVVKNLNRSLTLQTITIGVVSIPQMVFTNLIMITHVNRTNEFNA